LSRKELFKPVFACDFLAFEYGGEELKLLLIVRANPPFKGEWAFPGGFLEENENLKQCAERELLEETNIKVPASIQLYTAGNPGRDPRFRTVTAIYAGFLAEIKQRAGDDAAEAKLFSISEILNLGTLAFDHMELLFPLMDRIWKLTEGGKLFADIFKMRDPESAKSKFEHAYNFMLKKL